MKHVLTLKENDLPELLPVFPLRGFLVFPGLNLPLNIFEPRYISLVNDALATPHRLIGMIQPTPQSNKSDDSPELSPVGCAARIISYTEASQDRYVIAVGGVARFRITKEEGSFNGYRRVIPEWNGFLDDLRPGNDSILPDELKNLLSVSTDYFEDKSLHFPEQELSDRSPDEMVNLLSILSPFTDDEKQALLEAPSVGRRAVLVRSFMENALRNSLPGEVTIH